MSKRYVSVIAMTALLGWTGASRATGLIYEPVDPAFGGNPQNGQFLLDVANAQNKYKDPSLASFSGLTTQSPLEQFNNQLQQAILSRVASWSDG
jgi:curli production assembly/transport component CsgF